MYRNKKRPRPQPPSSRHLNLSLWLLLLSLWMGSFRRLGYQHIIYKNSKKEIKIPWLRLCVVVVVLWLELVLVVVLHRTHVLNNINCIAVEMLRSCSLIVSLYQLRNQYKDQYKRTKKNLSCGFMPSSICAICFCNGCCSLRGCQWIEWKKRPGIGRFGPYIWVLYPDQ